MKYNFTFVLIVFGSFISNMLSMEKFEKLILVSDLIFFMVLHFYIISEKYKKYDVLNNFTVQPFFQAFSMSKFNRASIKTTEFANYSTGALITLLRMLNTSQNTNYSGR